MQQNMSIFFRFEGSQAVLAHPSGKKAGWKEGTALGNEHDKPFQVMSTGVIDQQGLHCV
jgi:hypothetical protein